MKNILFICFAVFAFLGKPQAQNQLFLDNFIELMEHQEETILSILEMMEEENYSFRPVAEENDFRTVALHIFSNMLWISKDYLGGGDFESMAKDREPNKEEIMAYAQKVFDYSLATLRKLEPHALKTKVNFFAGEKNVLQMVELMDNHFTHHKGQLTVYLRIKGHKPPKFIGW